MYKLLPTSSFSPNFDFNNNWVAKDFSKKNILQLRPDFESVISSLEAQIERKKYLTIDISEKNLKIGNATCHRAIWHVDGIGNNYALVCWGDFRTVFLKEEINFKRKASIKETSDEINSIVTREKFDYFELANGQSISYDSNTIHSGRIAEYDSKRILLRLCFSDYIRPANVILK